MAWGTEEEVERRNRILVAVYAYAYEICNESLISDYAFDALALAIRPEMSTGHNQLDEFFRAEFSPETGVWVRKHPNLPGLRRIYRGIRYGFKADVEHHSGADPQAA